LQPVRNVDAVAMYVVALDDYVAEVDADAKCHSAIGRQGSIAPGLGALHLDSTAHSVDDAVELDQQPVAHGLNQPAVVFRDLWLEHFVKLGLEVSARPFLVCLAEMSIASNVGDHHSGKSALHLAYSAPPTR
jgi:hypothetical protein